ncbi:MAG: DUF4349 domain-containing protein [Caldilinea sp. CFX5]|nr:DUF4349 domain-containing protein [Caldilinea sp. CFX5]
MKRFLLPLLALLIIGIWASYNTFFNTMSSTRMAREVARVSGQPASALMLQTSADSSFVSAAPAGMAVAAPAEAPAAEGGNQAGQPVASAASSVLDSRKIIRNAYLRIEAEDVVSALNTATRLSEQVGGYVVTSRTWRNGDLPYATLSFAVPVDRFEEALTQTRTLGEVQDENVTSQDVTGQFVDLEARIANLEATAVRIRSFLEDTKKVEEALNVNRELSNVESELEILKGQRNTLSQQTSFSTVTIEFFPVPPVVTTGEVLETVQTWSPVRTFNDALDVLLTLARIGIDLAIWVLTIGLPLLLVLSVLWWIIRHLFGIRARVAA